MIASQIITVREREELRRLAPQTGEVASLVLLGGVLRPTLFHRAIRRSVLDLPVAPGLSVLQLWAQQVEPLARAMGNPSFTVRLLLNAGARRPRTRWEAGSIPLHVEEDPAELRGTGGILRDLALGYDENARLLVASAAQILLSSARHLGMALLRSGADVALVAHQDGTPGSMMLTRCGCLQMIPSLGFIDMKEQALPLIARRHRVKVLLRMRPTGLCLLSPAGYLNALREYYLSRVMPSQPEAFAEEWQSAFAIVEEGATLERGARLHNSVVLGGAVVGKNAVVARSIVCPGAVVAAGQTVVGELVTPAKGEASR